MTILAISYLWTGVIPFFSEGKTHRTGMPAFFEVWIRILENPGVKRLDLILFYDPKKVEEWEINDRFKEKLVIHRIAQKRGYKHFFQMFSALRLAKSLIKKHKPDRYLGFGTISFMTWLFNRIHKAPDQRRLYGISTVFEDLELPKWKIFLKHPFSFLCFYLRCDRLFVSNDGSHGDWVFNKIGNQDTKFNFYYNGVDVEQVRASIERNSLTFLGRIYPWKGQIHLLKALVILKRDYGLRPQTYFIGQVSDENYLETMKEIIKEHQMTHVEFISGVDKYGVAEYLSKSVLTFSLYHTSNFGNVLIEALAYGTPVLTRNVNNSLDGLTEGSYIPIESYDPKEIAERIFHFLNSPEELKAVMENAKRFSEKNFTTWATRAELELAFLRGDE